MRGSLDNAVSWVTILLKASSSAVICNAAKARSMLASPLARFSAKAFLASYASFDEKSTLS